MKENESNGNKGDQRNTKGSTSTEKGNKGKENKGIGRNAKGKDKMPKERNATDRKGTQRKIENKGKPLVLNGNRRHERTTKKGKTRE